MFKSGAFLLLISSLLPAVDGYVGNPSPEAGLKACVTIQNYPLQPEKPCEGAYVSSTTFPTQVKPGSPCGPFHAQDGNTYYIKNQYCDLTTGEFKQDVAVGPNGCEGDFFQQIYSTDTCLFGFIKLKEKCQAGPCPADIEQKQTA